MQSRARNDDTPSASASSFDDRPRIFDSSLVEMSQNMHLYRATKLRKEEVCMGIPIRSPAIDLLTKEETMSKTALSPPKMALLRAAAHSRATRVTTPPDAERMTNCTRHVALPR